MSTVELLSTALAILSTTGGGLWVGFKAIMSELKDQTKTLAMLGERSNGVQVTLENHEKRLGDLEYYRTKESGIRSVEINKAVQDVTKTLETKTNGGTEYPNRTTDYTKRGK